MSVTLVPPSMGPTLGLTATMSGPVEFRDVGALMLAATIPPKVKPGVHEGGLGLRGGEGCG